MNDVLGVVVVALVVAYTPIQILQGIAPTTTQDNCFLSSIIELARILLHHYPALKHLYSITLTLRTVYTFQEQELALLHV